ncbi:MAG: hypothetical protein ACUVYA_15955 [Planctomycetota bacterium]
MSRRTLVIGALASLFGFLSGFAFAEEGVGCEERCRAMGTELKALCARADGTVDRECLRAVEARVAECLKACGEPPPPPPEPTCPERCKAKILEDVELCVRETGDREACWMGFEERVQACLASECGIEPPPPPPSCEERCERLGEELKVRCAREDGTVDERCLAAVEARVAECLKACGEPPPPPAPTCDEDCKLEAQARFDRCVAAGGSEEDCRREAGALLALCLERCAVGRPCENRCAVAAEIVAQGCALGGLGREECSRLANLVLERCVGLCRPGPACPERCEEAAAGAVRECAARGGEREECAAEGREVLANCLAKCGGGPVEEPPCDLQCEEKAEALARECAAQGGDETRCAAIRERFLQSCLAEHAANCAEEGKAAETRFRPFIRGDSNRDGRVDVSDPVHTLRWLFLAGAEPACADAADANDDGAIDVSDPIAVLGHLFLGAGALPEPVGVEGQDGTSDALVCAD